MITEKQLSILIPTRNRPAILKRTLDELRIQGFGGHPLTVYDDASDHPEENEEVVKQWPGAKFMRGAARQGQAKARNELMRACESDYALFLDDDSFPEQRESILAALETLAAAHLGIATFNYRALADGRLSVPLERGRRQTAGFLGGASLFHVPSVMKVGGYREFLVYGCEEPELGMRLWMAGVCVESWPDVIIIHNQFYTPEENRDYREYDYLYARNTILMASMNMPVLLGLPYGLLRSIRWVVYRKRNLPTKLRGIMDGILQTFIRWGERKPCGMAKAIAWMRFWSKSA